MLQEEGSKTQQRSLSCDAAPAAPQGALELYDLSEWPQMEAGWWQRTLALHWNAWAGTEGQRSAQVIDRSLGGGGYFDLCTEIY